MCLWSEATAQHVRHLRTDAAHHTRTTPRPAVCGRIRCHRIGDLVRQRVQQAWQLTQKSGNEMRLFLRLFECTTPREWTACGELTCFAPTASKTLQCRKQTIFGGAE